MTTATLASLSTLLGMMPERDTAATVGEELHSYLSTATALIAKHTGMSLATGETVLYFDTFGGYRATGLSAPSNFGKDAPQSVNLPVRGPLTGLTLLYRGEDSWDTRQDWDRATPLVENVDFIHEPELGRIRFLRRMRDMVRGLRVSYHVTGESHPDIAVGMTKSSFIAETGISTGLAPLAPLVSGVPFKLAKDSARAAAPGAGTMVSIKFAPAVARAVQHVTLNAPRDAPMFADGSQQLELKLYGEVMEGQETLLARVRAVTPFPAAIYTLEGNPRQAYDSYRVDLTGLGGAPVAVSKIDIGYMHPFWRHMEGSVPDQLSQACAVLAYHLYRRDDMDSMGRTTDASNRSFAGSGSIPTEVREMLRPFMQTGSGVTFI